MKETTGKVKTFVKEHKKELLVGLGLVVVGSVVGWKASDITRRKRGYIRICDERITNVLRDASNKCGRNNVKFCGYRQPDKAIKPEDLGELGNGIIHCISETNETPEFTHFIAIGPDK